MGNFDNLTYVYLVRHSPVDAPVNTCYGASDLGCEPQAFLNAVARISALLPAHCQFISSPLVRCSTLAAALAAPRAATVRLDPRWQERNCGAWENKNWDDVPRHELDAWATDFMDYAAPSAESVRTMQHRVLAAWAEVCTEIMASQTESQAGSQTKSGTGSQKTSKFKNWVILSHAGPIQLLLKHLQGHTTGTVLTPPASITRLELRCPLDQNIGFELVEMSQL